MRGLLQRGKGMKLTEAEQAILDGIRRHPEGVTIRVLGEECPVVASTDPVVRRSACQRLHNRGLIVRISTETGRSRIIWRAKRCGSTRPSWRSA